MNTASNLVVGQIGLRNSNIPSYKQVLQTYLVDPPQSLSKRRPLSPVIGARHKRPVRRRLYVVSMFRTSVRPLSPFMAHISITHLAQIQQLQKWETICLHGPQWKKFRPHHKSHIVQYNLLHYKLLLFRDKANHKLSRTAIRNIFQ